MADPVATVEKIVKIGLAIKTAVDTVRHNEEDCNKIKLSVLRFSAILLQLQQTGIRNDSPAMSGALEDLEETLERALELVTACQERATICCHLIAAGDLSKQLRRVKDDILHKVMLASFAINVHTTLVLLTIQAGSHPLPLQPQYANVEDPSHNTYSIQFQSLRCKLPLERRRARMRRAGGWSLTPSDPLAELRKFSSWELHTAINGGHIIGQGAFWKVYKSVLNDGNVVAIKIQKDQLWMRPHHQLLLASKFQHTNIVKVLGYGCEVGSSPVRMQQLEHKHDQAEERGYIWVDEYMPNGDLDKIIHESQLNWHSLSRVIEGVAHGIHYLHEQHVVHRDVKPSNILLDSDMTPKITDFDLSIVLEDDEIVEGNIFGTIGYMAPEYLAQGILSMKADVYSFGVTLLETVGSMCRLDTSVKDNIQYSDQERMVVVEIRSAWEAERMEELFDPSLLDGSQLMEVKRYTQVGLLCIQLDRADRPTMADVLEMLHDGQKELPTPKIPSLVKSVKKNRLKKWLRALLPGQTDR